jgi:hypothetical protein
VPRQPPPCVLTPLYDLTLPWWARSTFRMRIPTVLAALGLAVSTAAKITFINPPQFTRQIKATEHDVWVTGQTIDLRWSQPDKGKKLSVVLYQMNSTMAANYNGQFPGEDPPFEFITRK